MDQTIGIGYQVDGVQGVVAANNQVIGSFEKVVSKIQNVSGVVSALGGAFSTLKGSMSGLKSTGGIVDAFRGSSTSINAAGKGMERFNTALGGTPEKVWAAGAAIRRLTTIVQSYSSAVNSVKPVPMVAAQGQPGGVAPGTGKAAGATGSRGSRDVIPMVPRFMLMWRLGSEAVQGAHYLAADVALGRSRQKMAEGLGQLSPLGFNKDLKKQTELSAKLFNQKFWTVSAESYIDAMSMTASAFSVENLGFSNLDRMNQAALKVGLVAKMTAEKSSGLITKIMLGYINTLPEEVSAQLQKGLSAEVKGFGRVDMGGLAEGIAAQVSKTVAVTSAWGPDIQSAFRGAMPTLLERNYSLPVALAMTSAFVDIGYQGGQSGKVIRDVYEREPENLAKTLLYGAGLWKSQSASLDPQTLTENKRYNKMATEQALKVVQKYLGNEELAPELFNQVGEIVKKAEADGISLKELGFSQYYLPMIRQLIKKPLQKRIEENRGQIEGAIYTDLDKDIESSLEDAGTAYLRISNAFSNFWTTVADSPLAHGIAGPLSKSLNRMSTSMMLTKEIERKGLTQDQTAALYMHHEKSLVNAFGQEDADLIYGQMMRSAKGENGWSFLKAIPDNFYYGTMLGDDIAESARKSIGEFWENNISSPLRQLGDGWNSFVDQIMVSGMYPFQKMIELFDMIGAAVDGVKSKVAPYIPKFESPPGAAPKPEEYGDMPLSERMAVPFMSYQMPPMPTSQDQQPIQIDNKLHLDSRVIAQVVSDIIQRNRDTNYHTYGGDPMGFVT
jgi:hypothetical protein